MVAVLRTEGLSKNFGAFKAVDNLSLEVEEGDIYGFLGVNGAGKTTTMRMILRLIRATSGKVALFGQDIQTHFIDIMKRVGCLVELPAYYPYLSAWKNLEIVRLATGGIEEKRIPETLELVGLGKRMHDRVRTFSQGMRQRLGIAMALLPRPRLVLLDEPTNGLDPQGIRWLRDLLRGFAARGNAVLVSSHLLSEMDQLADEVIVIDRGRLVRQGSIAAVTGGRSSLRVAATDHAALGRALIAAGVEPRPDGDAAYTVTGVSAELVGEAALRAGVALTELTPHETTLEEAFLELTEGAER